MYIYLTWYKLEFSYGLGIYPISLFVKLGGITKGKYSLKDFYEMVEKYKVSDIIFYGNIERNIDTLSWVTSKLISERYHISLVVKYGDQVPIISTNRIITSVTSLRRVKKSQTWHNMSSDFTQNDIIILDTHLLEEIYRLRKFIIDNQIKAKIMFNKSRIAPKEILKAEIYDIEPYLGEVDICI